MRLGENKIFENTVKDKICICRGEIMCKVISIVSWKGGVGKTTSTVNISSYLKLQGKKVCAVDLDPQHSLSKHFGIFPGHLKDKPTIYDLINCAINDNDEDIDELVHKSIFKSSTFL